MCAVDTEKRKLGFEWNYSSTGYCDNFLAEKGNAVDFINSKISINFFVYVKFSNHFANTKTSAVPLNNSTNY